MSLIASEAAARSRDSLDSRQPSSGTGIHLTTFSDLERHCHDTAKQAGYERLLTDLGVDVESFSRLVQHPRVILAEQPGSWFCGGDMMRYRLLRSLIETSRFCDSSGVQSLATDASTRYGSKKLFVELDLHPQLRPVPLLGAAYSRRHRHRVYDAVPVAGSAYQRIATIFDLCDRMLSSARISAAAFTEEVTAIFKSGVAPGLRRLLPPRSDRRSLRKFGAELAADYDLEAALRPLAIARRELTDGMSWVRYWDRVNGAFLGTEIGDLGPLFNRFLLTIEDPVRTSRTLMRLTRHPADQPIAVAGVVTGDKKYRMVYFDPADRRFHYRQKGVRREVSWPRIRALAETDHTGGPSGTLEYLLMAASGIYLVADPGDGDNRFERRAREIHERYTGLAFPYVALTVPGGETSTDYLSIYHSGFDSACRSAVERFFE